MRTSSYLLVIVLSATMLTLTSCKSCSCSRSGETTVSVTKSHLSDSSSFAMSNGERCTIVANADIQYPSKVLVEGASLDDLKRLFARYVLDADDSMSFDDAMRQVVVNSMHQYDFMSEPMDDDADAAEGSARVAIKYVTNTCVSPVYNKNGVVTFERIDSVKRDGKVTSVTHRYYSFDVNKMVYIDVSRLFRDDALADIRQSLRQRLLIQNNAKDNDQLNDLGYFNVENISVTNNFYFTDEGVTWSYLPNDLAVEAIGEPRIAIPYDDLSDFLCEGSVIEALK